MVEAKQIGILLFSDVEELDAVGPWEVLSYWSRNFSEDGYAVSCLSRAGGLVQCAKGLVVQAHYSYTDAPPLEVLLYPGPYVSGLTETSGRYGCTVVGRDRRQIHE